jgi:hypothetical protein
VPGVDVERFIVPVDGSIFNPAGALNVPPVAPVVVNVVVPVAQKVPPLTVAVGLALTVTCIVADAAHPDVGVKVYGVVPMVEVLIVEGLHVPAIPSLEDEGSAVGGAFWQNGPIGSKAGVAEPVIVIVCDVVATHPPASVTLMVYTPGVRPVKTPLDDPVVLIVGPAMTKV